jgi:hypothetical protein
LFNEILTTDANTIFENDYFIIFEEPWNTEIFGREISINEIIISNSEFIQNIDYENKYFKIYGKIGFMIITSNENNFLGTSAFFIKKMELLEDDQ